MTIEKHRKRLEKLSIRELRLEYEKVFCEMTTSRHRTYLIGKTQYKGVLYEGEHKAIIEQEIFDEVQKKLEANRVAPRLYKPNKYGGILKGILRCKACGCGMGHSYSRKGHLRYRYYVCQNARSRGWANCPHPSLPANEIEKFVINEIRTIGLDDGMISEVVSQTRRSVKDEIDKHNKQLRLLRKELAGYKAQLKPLLAFPDEENEKISSLREKIAITDRDITSSSIRIDTLENNKLTPNDIRTACRKFDPLWDTLSTKEQWRILSLLLECVEFDAASESINITFAPSGIKMINQQLETKEAIA